MNTLLKPVIALTLLTSLLAGCGPETAQEDMSCEKLDGRTYYSETLELGGRTANGESKAHWSLSFNGSEVSFYSTDTIETSHYTCADGIVITQLLNEQTMVLGDNMDSLSFGSVDYRHMKVNSNDNICADITGKKYIDPDTIPDPNPAGAQLPAVFFEFKSDQTVRYNTGANITEGYYECGTGKLHIHRSKSDKNPMTASLAKDKLVIRSGEKTLVLEPESADEPVLCTQQYDPVCSVTPINCLIAPCADGAYKTFGNRCTSDGAKAMFQSEGECGKLEGTPYKEEKPAICTKEYKPVCSVTPINCITAPCADGIYKSFGNRCMSDGAKAMFQAEGECGKLEGKEYWKETPSICTLQYDPVCSVIPINCITEPCADGAHKTFGNQCQSDAAKAMFKSEGKCGKLEGKEYWKKGPPACNDNYEVCGGVSSNEPCRGLPCPVMKYKTFRNLCEMRDAEATELDLKACGKKEGSLVTEITGMACTADYTPVCGKKETGIVCVKAPCYSSEYQTYGNACSAGLDRAQVVFAGECGDLSTQVATSEPAVSIVTDLPKSTSRAASASKAEIKDDVLIVTLTYSGCDQKHFSLYASSVFAESFPVQASTVFIGAGKGDDCDAEFSTEFSYDLRPLKHSYQQSYKSDTGSVILGSIGVTYTF